MPKTTCLACISAICLLVCFCPAADTPADFLPLLDQLEKAQTPDERGFDQSANGDGPGKRMVRMLGSPQIWDPYGTPNLRKTFIARLRKRWGAEGEAMLHGLQLRPPVPGHVEVNAAGVRFVCDLEKMRRQFLLNNGKLYELGAMDGSFPPSGFMLGSQSGVWVSPTKALDGFVLVLRENGQPPWRLDECNHFSHDFATATFNFAANDWTVSRIDFPAATEPALFSRLTIANHSKRERSLDIDFIADINIRPDWRTTAQKNQQNDLDMIESRNGLIRAWDPKLQRSMIVLGADRPEAQLRIEDARVTFTYRLTIPADGTVDLTVLLQAGLESSNARWSAIFRTLLARSAQELQARKNRTAAQISSGVHFTCSDPRLSEAFALAKANLALLTADCRPNYPDVYLMAGVPVYPRLFACDSCIALPGATAAGFWPQAKGTLACLAFQARKQKSLVPHESATDGALIGPSNSQETTQFIATAAHYLRWSADQKFAADLYPLLTSAMAAHRAKFAKDGYPSGAALIETHGMGPRKIDAASWQHAALAALADVAHMLGKEQDARSWRTEATRYRVAMQRDWWIQQQHMWADSLDAENRSKHDGLWSVVFPLLTDVASASQSSFTIDALEAGWVNQWGGVHTRQPDISQQGSGVVTTGVFAQAAFAHQRSDLGLKLLLQNAQAPKQDRMPGAFTEMIPPGGSDFAQLWSAGPFLAAIVEGLAGIRPDAATHQVEFSPQLPEGLEWLTLEHLRVGDHELRVDVRRVNNKTVSSVNHIKGSQPLLIVYAPANQQKGIDLNDKRVDPTAQRINRLDRELKVVKYAVPAGGTATFAQ
jgi:glycogen debranching enzyme